MAKLPRFVKRLSIAIGTVAGIATPFILNVGTGVGLDWYISRGDWGEIAFGLVAAFVVFWVFWGLTRLVYRICARVNRSLPQDTRPRLLDVRQRIVVWVVASLLTVISIWHGFADAWDSYSDEFDLSASSLLWLGVFPVLLLGVALFLHIMRRKE